MNSLLRTNQTIAAIATAISSGQGGIAIIRVSGPLAEEVCKKIVYVPGKQSWESHKIIYGHVMDEEKEKQIDEVLLLIMKAPRSFTGEDIVEIHCHGGLIVVQSILDRVLAHPDVRRAMPGEFSQRAVLNGKLNLTQAEAISDLISARSQKAAQLAIAGLNGNIKRTISSLRNRLLDQLSEIEARVDFEDDLEPLNEKKVLDELCLIQEGIQKIINDGERVQCFRNGLKVAIIGRPNVGKSSLLNKISRYKKAIVTDQPGTTRDLVESEIVLQGIPIILVDTAGIRETNNEAEKIGISLSKNALIESDIVILMFNISEGWNKEDQIIFDDIPKETPTIIVGNKNDLQESKKAVAAINNSPLNQEIILSSTLTGEGEDLLINNLLDLASSSKTEGIEMALNERQQDLAKKAADALNRTQEVAAQQLPWDFWTIDIREAIHVLGELTGEEITEAVLERIFSRFCIGK